MKRILVIDDSDMYLNFVKTVLESKYDIITAKSGNEALSHLSKGFIPSLILLDIIMPEIDGWDVFKIIKGVSLLREVPIVFFTSLNNEDDIKRGTAFGAVDFITKPLEKDDFLKRIDLLMEKT